jgi:hypothetical protein
MTYVTYVTYVGYAEFASCHQKRWFVHPLFFVCAYIYRIDILSHYSPVQP